MTENSKLPIYRINFCPIVPADKSGKDRLGKSVEIGTVWQRKQAGKGAILKLTIVPENFREGVVFLDPITKQDRGFA